LVISSPFVYRGEMAPSFPISFFAAVVLAAIAAYLLMRLSRPGITDSPWFWAFAFSAMGTIGVLVIAPKYDDRQKRLEARFEGRERMAQRRQLDNQSDRSESIGPERPEEYGYDQQRRVPLVYLGSILFVAAVGSGAMLWRTEQRDFKQGGYESSDLPADAHQDQKDRKRRGSFK